MLASEGRSLTFTRRALVHALILALVGGAALAASPIRANGTCGELWTTGYASEQFPGRTADGTPTRGNEWSIAATHPRFPFGTVITLDSVGPLRVADRGMLGYDHIDVLVYSAREAYALTGWKGACW